MSMKCSILMFLATFAAACAQAKLNDAVEMTGGEFSCSGSADWYECWDDAYEGDSCIRSGNVSYYESSTLNLAVKMSEASSVSFWWKHEGSGWYSFYVDGNYYELYSEDATAWSEFRVELTEGSHTLTWSNQASTYYGNGGAIYVDKISIPGYMILDPDSADPNNTLWTTTDKKTFRSGIIGNGKYSYKTMTVDGKGVLSFRWRVSSECHFDRLEATFDGKEIVPPISGETEWVKVVYTNEQAGGHTVRWEYSKDGDTSIGDDCGYVSGINWGDGTIPFVYDKAEGNYRSGEVLDAETSCAELLISAADSFSWGWRVDSEQDHDFLRCYVDGKLERSISGTTDWSWPSAGGENWGASAHTIRFEYAKDDSGSSGEDSGYLYVYSDMIAWRVNGLTPSVGGGAWTCQSEWNDSTYTTETYYQSAQASSDNPSILPVTVSSNGEISFRYRSSDSNSSYLMLYVDGKCVKSFVVMGTYDSYSSWSSATYKIKEPGAHLVEWRAYSYDGGRVCLKLVGSHDGYPWYTGTRKPWTVDAKDYVNISDDDVGDKGWVESEVDWYNGYRSGKIGAGQTSRITARVGYCYGGISFYWKNSGSHAGTLNFYVNGELQSSLTGATDSLEYYSDYLSLYNDENTLVWEYVNGDDAVDGEDFGWLANVSWSDYGYGTSLDWGTLGFDADEENPETPATTYVWTTVTNSDDSVTLTGVTPTPSGWVNLPSEVDGMSVTSIGRKVFGEFYWYNEPNITYVVIPEGVVEIEASAFNGLSSLCGVALPSTLREIGDSSFYATSITAVKVPEGVRRIGNSAFGDTGLEIAILPSTLADLAIEQDPDDYPFYSYNPFCGCAESCVFQFPNGNSRYSVVDGHIVSADGVLVSGVVVDGEATIPPCVSKIGGYAFGWQKTLRDVFIPGTVEIVGYDAFYDSGIESVEVGEGVRCLVNAFRHCSRLQSVTLSEGLEKMLGTSFYLTPVTRLEIPSTVTQFANTLSEMTNLQEVVFLGNAPTDQMDYTWFWYSVPSSAVVKVKKGTTGWNGAYSAELPSSGYWPWNSSSNGRKIFWYGDDPIEWTDPWWNHVNVSFSDKGWTGQRGVYTSPGWKDSVYSSSVHTNKAAIAVNGPGIISLDVMATGSETSSRCVFVLIDGVQMDSCFAGSLGNSYSRSPGWSHFEYAIAEEGAHSVVVEYRVKNNYYGGAENAYLNLQNVAWTPKSNWEKPDYVWETRDNGDGTVTIVSVSPAPAFDLEIPAVIGGKRVAAVGTQYDGYTYVNQFTPSISLLTSVSIPEGVECLNRFALSGCRRLKSVKFPSTLSTIESYALSGCYSLSRVTFRGDCPKFGESIYDAFPQGCVITVTYGTTGWGDTVIPGFWYGYPIEYVRMTIAQALNNEVLNFDNDEDYPWDSTFDASHDSIASVRSGVIGNGQTTQIRATVEGAGTLSFWWKVDSETFVYRGKTYLADMAAFTCDGERLEFGGTEDWSFVTMKLPAGKHDLMWSFEKDAEDDVDWSGEDCVWLDEVTWSPDVIAPTLDELANVFGEDSDVAKNITNEAELAVFNVFLKECSISSAADLSTAQMQYAFQSFKLSEIMTAPQLFEAEPVLKIDDLELSGGNLSLTISLTAGAEAIQLAKDKLAEKIRVGTSLDSIVGAPSILDSPSADGTFLTFTISPPQGGQGFVKVIVE